eukprot:COSAG05_NODE_1213_length_5492_cov_12.157983_7_plen_183_part_00
MLRPATVALSVLLLTGTAAGNCDSHCMPKNCLQTDETTLATTVDAKIQALNNLKNTEPALRATVMKAKTALANAQTNLTAAQKAKSQMDGTVEADATMRSKASAAYRQAQKVFDDETTACVGKTGEGAARLLLLPVPPLSSLLCLGSVGVVLSQWPLGAYLILASWCVSHTQSRARAISSRI